jgi:hypothetical protein
MKTRIATLMIACVFIFTGFTQANEPVPASKSVSSSIAKMIASEIDYPDFARIDDFECCVLVRLTINKDGTFGVECANCQDNRLRLYVEDHIAELSSEEFADFAGQTVAIKLVFRLLD